MIANRSFLFLLKVAKKKTAFRYILSSTLSYPILLHRNPHLRKPLSTPRGIAITAPVSQSHASKSLPITRTPSITPSSRMETSLPRPREEHSSITRARYIARVFVRVSETLFVVLLYAPEADQFLPS